MGAGGTRGIAVFACGPCDILEVIRTAHPVESRVVINHTPHIEPLAAAGDRERWCVVLVNRREGRILFGDQDGLEEFENVHDDTLNQQQQGGWSQRRYEESQEGEKRDHLDNVSARLLWHVRAHPFDRLLVVGPEPIDAEFEQRLHPYVKERLVKGSAKVDVEAASPADVLTAITPVFEKQLPPARARGDRAARAGLGRGPDGLAVAGLHDVLDALNQQRVECLLLEPRVSRRGWLDPTTGFLSAEPGDAPSGGELVEQEDVLELAIERAVEQSAEVLILRDQPDLGPHGGVAALLRF